MSESRARTRSRRSSGSRRGFELCMGWWTRTYTTRTLGTSVDELCEAADQSPARKEASGAVCRGTRRRLGRGGLDHSLDRRQPLTPDPLTYSIQEWREQPEQANRVGITAERDPRSAIHRLEREVALGPHWADLCFEFDSAVGLDRKEACCRFAHLS